MEQVDYRGCEISYPRIRRDTSGWTVNVASIYPALLAKLGGRSLVVTDHRSLEGAIEEAKRRVDAALG